MAHKKMDFASFFEGARRSTTYWVERAKIEFTEEVVREMEKQKLTRTDLARRLEKSQAYVTKILRGDNNFTLETMVKVARGLDTELQLHLQPK